MLLKKVIYYIIFPFEVCFIFLITLNKPIDTRPPKDCTVIEKLLYRFNFSKKLATYVGYERLGVKYKDKEFHEMIKKYLND